MKGYGKKGSKPVKKSKTYSAMKKKTKKPKASKKKPAAKSSYGY